MISLTDFNFEKRLSLGNDFLDEDLDRIFSKLEIAARSSFKDDLHFKKSDFDFIRDEISKLFDAQEAYIRFLGKGSFMFHKHCHDVILSKLLPDLKNHLSSSSFSYESCQTDLGILAGTLAGHIITEDFKLNDNSECMLRYQTPMSGIRIESDIHCILENVFKIKSEIKDSVIEIDPYNCFCYERIYNLNDKNKVNVYVLLENSIIYSIMKKLFHSDCFEQNLFFDKFALSFTEEMSKSISSSFRPESVYETESERKLSFAESENLLSQSFTYKIFFSSSVGNICLLAERK